MGKVSDVGNPGTNEIRRESAKCVVVDQANNTLINAQSLGSNSIMLLTVNLDGKISKHSFVAQIKESPRCDAMWKEKLRDLLPFVSQRM